jgi:succinate dehydrogenase / fumarate reductase, cytochrome b subunit
MEMVAEPWSMSSLVIAATGLALVLFVLAHLGAVGLSLGSPLAFEALATALHRQFWLPWAESSLAIAALAHPLDSLRRQLVLRRARGTPPVSLVSRRQGPLESLAAFAGRAMAWSGGMLLLFLIVHLAQLRWHRPPAGQELATLMAVLQRPWWLALYCGAGLALALHLLHGVESAHRSLGLLDAGNGGRIRAAGRLLAVLLGTGFAALPLALVLQGAGSARAALGGAP